MADMSKHGQLKESSASALAEVAAPSPVRLGVRRTPEEQAEYEAWQADMNARYKASGSPRAMTDEELDEVIRRCRREGEPVRWNKLHRSSLHDLRMMRGMHATEDRDLTPEELDEWEEWGFRNHDDP